MPDDRSSLSNLRDIVIPEPPPVWPLAPGAWIILGIVLAFVFFLVWRIHVQRRRNAYRKAGLRLLSSARTMHDVAIVLKRVALAVFPREQVASLYGDAWVVFLNMTYPKMNFEMLVACDEHAVPDNNLIAMASAWIRHHRVPHSGDGESG